jgi:hypothetical protein
LRVSSEKSSKSGSFWTGKIIPAIETTHREPIMTLVKWRQTAIWRSGSADSLSLYQLDQAMEDCFVRTLPAIALAAVGAAALAGTAIAANPKATAATTHVMNVALPGGSVAHIRYAGDVAPKVTVESRPLAGFGASWGMFPSFAGFGKIMAEMQRQSQEMMRHAQQMSRHPNGAHPYIASYGSLPAGQTSTTVVSVSNGGATCTRSTEVVSQGPGKAPKVTSSVSGQCGAAPAPSAPVNRT